MAETGDRAIALVAASQHGLITRIQLTDAGLGRGAIAHRVAQGRLHRVHRGVYLVGHPVLPERARELAAVLACGANAVLSHRSAAQLWGLVPAVTDAGPVDVTVVGRNCGHRPRVRVHRVGRLEPADVRTRWAIPITAPARTLLDLGEVVEWRVLERAVDEAQTRRLTRHEDLRAILARATGRHGVAPLRAVLEREHGPTITRSEAEERLLARLRAARLPAPRVNVRVGPYEVDFLWPAQRLAVEVDGYAFHSTRASFERDRSRDVELQLRGLRVMRITWRQIVDCPDAILVRIAQALVTSPSTR